MTLNPGTVTGGANSTGTVTLTAAAPAGGAVVTLTSSKTNAATVPASVTVAAGATTATFTITTKTVTAGTVATITSTYDGISKAVGLVVNPLLGSLTLNPSVLTGGARHQHRHSDTHQRGAGRRCGGDADERQHQCSHGSGIGHRGCRGDNDNLRGHNQDGDGRYAGEHHGHLRWCVQDRHADGESARLAGVSVNPAAVTGGAGSTGTVTLGQAAPAGGAVVTLASSNINAATVPASVTVAANATTATFAIATKAVTAVTAVTITATYSGVAKTATLTVNPPAALAGVSVNPAAVTGAAGSTGTVTLGAAAPAGGAVVTLASNNINAATVPGIGDGAGECHHGDLRDCDQGGDRRDRGDDHGHLQRRGQDRDADGESRGPGGAGRRDHEPGNDDIRQRLDGNGDADRGSSGWRSRHRAVQQ